MLKLVVPFLTIFILATNTYAQEVSKSDWITYMKGAIPTAFCQEDGYIMQCFGISRGECISASGKAMDSCIFLADENLPDILNAAAGQKWGTTLGNCTDNILEQQYAKKKSKDKKCYNPKNWLK